MVTHILFKIKSMPLSATSREGQPDDDLHTVQNQKHDLVSNKQRRPARCWLTYYSESKAWLCQQWAGKASQMLTYILFKTKRTQSMLQSVTSRNGQPDADLPPVKTQSVLLSVTSRKVQPDADLHAGQSPEHVPLSNKHEGQARCWLTSCLKPRACSCQK